MGGEQVDMDMLTALSKQALDASTQETTDAGYLSMASKWVDFCVEFSLDWRHVSLGSWIRFAAWRVLVHGVKIDSVEKTLTALRHFHKRQTLARFSISKAKVPTVSCG
jgi:hypothetical protein